MPQTRENYYVLTGTPGTGKTTLIEAFRKMGLVCADEPARSILKEQLAVDGPALPSKSPAAFVQAMLRRQVETFSGLNSTTQTVLFDRGIPDLIAYAVRFGINPSEFELAGYEYRYNSKVFILPPWKGIFVNDDLRKLSFEEALKFHDALVNAYEKLGYELVTVPLFSVQERMDFITASLNHCS